MSFTAPSTLASRLSLVAGACLALCGAAVQAAAPTPAELNSIVLYGNTTIAQDSTSAWGVWEQLDPPAAGPAQPGINTPSRPELYRTLAQVNVQETLVPSLVVEPTAPLLCTSLSRCGFGRAQVSTSTYSPMDEEGTSNSSNIFAYHMLVTPADTENPAELRAASVLGTTDTPATTSTTYSAPYTVTVQSQALGGSDAVVASDSGLLYNYGYGYVGKTAIPGGAQRFSLIAYELNSTARQYYDNGNTILAGWYDNPVYRYTSGNDMQNTQQFQQSQVVIGTTTSDGDMAALRAANATATYTGFDGYALNNSSPNVKLSVNFGNGTFTGSVNNGVDGGVEWQTTARGTQVAGAVGVNIDKGVITGANFVSTALSATDGSIKAGSVVQGAFFGPNAAAAGGVVNITKTSNSGRYTNATFVSPFLAVKDSLIKVKTPAAPSAPIIMPIIIGPAAAAR